MLFPKKVKHRKWHKGRSLGRKIDTRGTYLSYGNFGLKALESGRLNSKQIEAGRRAISNFMKREGKLWIRVFPDRPITKKPPEVTMGGGKGDVDHYVFQVRGGRILYEMDGVTKEIAAEAMRLAGHKMPIKTKFISKI